MNAEWIIYEGETYQLEWYYDKSGRSQALEYFEELPNEQKRKAIHLFIVMGDIGKIQNKTKFRNESDGIYAFKPKPDRFLCFFFKEKKRAIAYKSDYEKRVEEGEYYE